MDDDASHVSFRPIVFRSAPKASNVPELRFSVKAGKKLEGKTGQIDPRIYIPYGEDSVETINVDFQ